MNNNENSPRADNINFFGKRIGTFLSITCTFVGTAFAMDYVNAVPFKHVTPDAVRQQLSSSDESFNIVSPAVRRVADENFASLNTVDEAIRIDMDKSSWVGGFNLADVASNQNQLAMATASLKTESWIKPSYDNRTFGVDKYNITENTVTSIVQASEKTGVSIGYLLAVADRESSFREKIKAPTSSAKGLFQMTSQTWGSTMHKFGPTLGYSEEASTVRKNSSGKIYFTSNNARKNVLAMRDEPEHAALLSAALTVDNKRRVESIIGRSLKDYEVYMAHFFGVNNAARFLKYAARTPKRYPSSIRAFDAARKANKPIFYNMRTGRERTFGQVYAMIKNDMQKKIAYYSLEYAKVSSEEHHKAREMLYKLVK